MKHRLVLLWWLVVVSRFLAQDPPAPSEPANIVRLTTPVALDGNPSEWSAIPPTTLSSKAGRATFRLGMDALNFYAFVEVTDPSPLRNSAARPEEMLKGGDALAFYFKHPKGGPQRVLIGLLNGETLIYAHRPKSKEKQPFVFSSPVGTAPFEYVGPLDEAKALLVPNASGYVAEISLPWRSLVGFKPAPMAFDFQVIYSDPAGSQNVDALWWHATSGPGLTIEDLPTEARLYPETWGEAVIVDKAPAPAPGAPQSPDRSGPPAAASIPLTLPRAGKLTLVITDARGWIYRELVRAEDYQAGPHTIEWDGRDRYGDVLPAGAYRWKAMLFDGVGIKFLGSVGNSARPWYRTEDGLGSFGGQHGFYGTVAADAGGVYLGGGGQEGVPPLCKINASTGLQFWKRSVGSFQFALGVTADEGFTVLLCSTGTKPDRKLALMRLDPESGKPIKFGKKAEIDLDAPGELGQTAADVAIAGGRAFFSIPASKRIGGLDLKTGAKLPDIGLEAWGLARVDGNTLLACTKNSVVRLDVTTGKTTPVLTGLMQPRDVAIDPKTGDLFVSDLGASQQIKKYSAAGKLLGAFGRPGGKPASMSPYDPLAFDNVTTLVFGPDGNLWMKEVSPTPKRFIRLTPDGRWLEDICGPIAYNCFGPDLDDVATIYYNPNDDTPRFIEARVDYAGYAADAGKEGNWSIAAIHDLSLGADGATINPVMAEVAQKGYGHIVAFKANNGKRFLFRLSKRNRANLPTGAGLWVWQKDRWIPALFLAGDEKKSNGLSWRDLNGDGLVQPNESFATPHLDRYSWIDRDLVLHGFDGLLAPSSFDPRGLPIYGNGKFTPHLKEGSPYFEINGANFASATVNGAVYYAVNAGAARVLTHWDRATDNRLIKVSGGKIEWMTGIHGARGGYTEFNTMTGIAGIVDDLVVAHNVEPASYITYTTDGLVLGDASADPTGTRPKVGPTAINIESFTGLFIKDAPTGRRLLFFVASGDNRIVELTGPGQTQRFEGELKLASGSAPAAARLPVIPYASWYGNYSRGLGIDGLDSEWNPGVPRISVSGRSGTIADIRFRRDAGSLFVMADVLDSTPLETGEGVVLDFGRTGHHADVSIALTAPAQSKGETTGRASLIRYGKAKAEPAINIGVTKRWENLGYHLEAEIPLKLLPEFSADRSQTYERETIDPRTGTMTKVDKKTEVLPDLKAPLFLNVRVFRKEASTVTTQALTAQGLAPVNLP